MSVCVLAGGLQVLMLWPERGRVLSACFNYLLTPDQLRDAVKTLRKVRGGLEGWIVPALEWTQADLGAIKNPEHARPDLLAIIPELLHECLDLPVAEAWRRRRRQPQQQWAERLEKDGPRSPGRSPAPFVDS